MIKIKVSYEDPQEAIPLLSAINKAVRVQKVKTYQKTEGEKYCRMYIQAVKK